MINCITLRAKFLFVDDLYQLGRVSGAGADACQAKNSFWSSVMNPRNEAAFRQTGQLKGPVVKRYLKAETNCFSEITLSLTLVPLKATGLFKC